MIKYFIIPGFRKSGTTYAHDVLSQTRRYNHHLQKETQVYALKNITSRERIFFLNKYGDPPFLDGSQFSLDNEDLLVNLNLDWGDQWRSLIIVRDPIERAFSSYSHARYYYPKIEKRTWERVVDGFLKRENPLDDEMYQHVQRLSESYLSKRIGMDYFLDCTSMFDHFRHSRFVNILGKLKTSENETYVRIVSFRELISRGLASVLDDPELEKQGGASDLLTNKSINPKLKWIAKLGSLFPNGIKIPVKDKLGVLLSHDKSSLFYRNKELRARLCDSYGFLSAVEQNKVKDLFDFRGWQRAR